ncbi:hypothetical protein J2TS4_28420 [Paenibacillus sp. J2TS4]|nr:hypothetical protein J2TS4_28420 [Paenibacillus sp. J2TS4]
MKMPGTRDILHVMMEVYHFVSTPFRKKLLITIIAWPTLIAIITHSFRFTLYSRPDILYF